jgi:predicted MFS family arabinose efflux permease
MQSVQNLGLAVFSLVSGVLLEEYGYFALELFFLCLCIVGLICAFVLYFVDKFKGNILI